MNKPKEKLALKLKTRPSEKVSISIPKDTLKSLEHIAKSKEMSLEALLKFYIGQGLRQELTKQFSDNFPESISEVRT